jgi:hypothetical protein
MMGTLLRAAVAAASLLLSCGTAFAQVSADDANKSNNPLNPATGVNVQVQYTPELYESDQHTNDLLLRLSQPFAPGHLIKAPQIVRLTAPISTRPDPTGGNKTGLGDLNLFDIFVLGKSASGIEFGAGPLSTLPTATDDALGTGKWQAGVAGMVVHTSTSGVRAGLLQWQASFAGDNDRADVSTLTFQPLLIQNLPRGWYLRSTAIWTFDLKNDHHWIPLGIGAGKV